jgi:hypothetical protein
MRRIILILIFISLVYLNANIKILEETRNKVIIELELKNYSITEDDNYSYINLKNRSREEDAGKPDLPFEILNLAIPPDGDISVEILSQETQKRKLNKPIAPIPEIIKENKTFSYNYKINQLHYSKTHEFYELPDGYKYRYYDIRPLKINPFLYNFEQNELTVCKKIILKIDIEGDISYRNEIPDKFENIYRQFIFNYKNAKDWKTKDDPGINKMPFSNSDFWFGFEVEEQGLYKLTYNELSQLPLFCDPQSVRLFTMEKIYLKDSPDRHEYIVKEIPLFIDKENKESSFAPDDRIYFSYENYEESESELKTIYFWLTFGGRFGKKPERLENFKNKNSALPVSNFYEKEYTSLLERDSYVECLFIYPGVFFNQTEELAEFHLSYYNLDCEIANQQNIFDEYSGGQPDPLAIKNFIHDFWLTSPAGDSLQYVILMGSGTNEWDNPTEKNKIMAYDSSDDNFVTFNFSYAELIISRLPAQNVEQMNFLIERIQKYVEEPTPGWWKNKVLIMADDENKNGALEGIVGTGLNHTLLAQETGDLLSRGVYIDKVLGLEYSFDEYNNKPDARNELIRRVNQGRLVWYYIGHGNPDVLGDEDYFRASEHLRLLENIDHLPFFIAASCSVGEFDSPHFDCMAERLLFVEDGGSIASLAASRSCSGSANTRIMKECLEKLVNDRENLGNSVYAAKLLNNYISTSRLYNLLGDPVIFVVPPERTGSISNIPDSLRARQTISIDGDFDTNMQSNLNGEIRVFDTEYGIHYTNTLNEQVYSVDYTRNGSSFFTGYIEISNGTYDASFIVPDDIRNGEKGRIMSYVFDDRTYEYFVNYFYPVKLSRISVDSISSSAPSVQLYLGSKYFKDGDYVSTSPLLIAEIEDENGINILGSAGHKILVLLDDFDPLDVTEQFIYDIGSYTKGELTWQFSDLSEGLHTLCFIVFDNFNVPTIAETSFRAKKSGKVAIKQMLPYPNPMKDDGYFTFVITEDADITITIYTITGRKIQTIKKPGCEAGYNQIYWNGRDGDNDRIANNTYFYKIKAKQLEDKVITEKIGKIIILK